MADHEIKLTATLDTSSINTAIQQTRVNQTGGASSSGGSGMGSVATVGAVTGGVNTITRGLKHAMNAWERSILMSIRLINAQLTRLMLPLSTLVSQLWLVHGRVRGMDQVFGNFSNALQSSSEELTKANDTLRASIKELTTTTNQASNSMRNAGQNANGGFGGFDSLLGRKIAPGGGFGPIAGRLVGIGAVYSAYSNTKKLFDTTDPEGKSAFSKFSNTIDWITSPFAKMAKEAEKDAKMVQESKDRLAEFTEQLKRLNELARDAGLDRYTRQQKEFLEVITDSELPAYLKEHGDKLEKLKDKYNKMNDSLSRGEVAVLGIDKFIKEMQQVAHEVDIEQGLFDKASSKMKQLNDETKRLAEETERLGKEYSRQSQSHQDSIDSEKRASSRRQWSSMSMDDLIMEKSGLNSQWNKSNEAIQKVDAEIRRLQEFYDLQNTNEGRKDIMQKINEQLQQRGRLVGQRNEALGDIERINGLMKAFEEATKTLEEKSQELQDSESFKQWKEGLKGMGGSALTKELKEAKDKRAELYSSILYDYERASKERSPEARNGIRKQIEIQLKEMGDVDSRISELESKTKFGFDDPTEAMTSMGRMGMYMSGTEMTLTDPKLEKLDHISMTLWKIERNTQNQTVSRFM